MKILVVHRQKEVLGQIKSVLHPHNSIIRFSDSGLDGLLAARIERFDLILCSTDLPVITGFEMVRSVRNSSMNKTTPVVFLAPEAQESTRRHGELLGMAAMFDTQAWGDELSTFVSTNITPARDIAWEDLTTATR